MMPWPPFPFKGSDTQRKSIDIENVNFLPKPFSVTELAEAARNAAASKQSGK